MYCANVLILKECVASDSLGQVRRFGTLPSTPSECSTTNDSYYQLHSCDMLQAIPTDYGEGEFIPNLKHTNIIFCNHIDS